MPGLREMQPDDLALVAGWLAYPHVARWYLAGSSVEQELESLAQAIRREQAVHPLIVVEAGEPIGWCQWYRCDDEPDWAAEIGAGPGDIGIDYAIGDPNRIGRGVGTALVADLLRTVRAEHPGAAFMSDPDARNLASRRVLEKNDFQLIAVKSVPSEPTDDAMAIYRLPSGRL